MTIPELMKALRQKLTDEEFWTLYEYMDEDPPAGPLWEAVADEAIKIRPEEFEEWRPKQVLKEEIK